MNFSDFINEKIKENINENVDDINDDDIDDIDDDDIDDIDDTTYTKQDLIDFINTLDDDDADYFFKIILSEVEDINLDLDDDYYDDTNIKNVEDSEIKNIGEKRIRFKKASQRKEKIRRSLAAFKIQKMKRARERKKNMGAHLRFLRQQRRYRKKYNRMHKMDLKKYAQNYYKNNKK